ncbi:centrosome-associated protein CEP250-like [Clarias gariepinus]|uniref:centrosome-associated protein CEP250-like n=1 Tax=Clarias gariepinus TaxID=13013 RepID=UPI00234C1C72|nr:centrosome-associated protein CEP250-like [Clarias gariepinus]
MSRSSSPEAHWDRLEVWMNALTSNLLPEPTGDLQNLSREQLDDNLSALMARDPTQDYSHKELAKIIGSLAHNLLGHAKLSEATIHHKEQEAAVLKLQAGEAQKNLVLCQRQLEQLKSETQDRTADEKDPELQEELERLQNALTDLRADTAHREKQEKDAREKLSEKLEQAEALLMRAETELKEREARARAYEGHLRSTRTEVCTLAQQRDYLKEELDTVHRELKHAYRLQGDPEREMHTTEFPLTSGLVPPSQNILIGKGGESPVLKTSAASIPEPLAAGRGLEPFPRLSSDHGVSTKELDKLARNIPVFTPNPAGGHDVHSYLNDVDFHLQTVTNATTRDRLYLLRITASREVRSFLDRQTETVKRDYQQLQQALIREFSDPESEQGLITAMDLKQGRQETTQAYYNRLRQAYFGARNEPGMEDVINFRSLFLRNLHPTVSHHLGVLACPRTMSTQQLRELAHKAYAKQRAASEKTGKTPTIYPVSNQSVELALEGAEQSPNDNRMAGPFPANGGQRGHGDAPPKHQTGHSERPWDRSQTPPNPQGGATWEGKRRPKRNRFSAKQAPNSGNQQQNPSQHARDQSRFKPSTDPNREATFESAEIMRVLKELLQKKHHKRDKKDESDQL